MTLVTMLIAQEGTVAKDTSGLEAKVDVKEVDSCALQAQLLTLRQQCFTTAVATPRARVALMPWPFFELQENLAGLVLAALARGVVRPPSDKPRATDWSWRRRSRRRWSHCGKLPPSPGL